MVIQKTLISGSDGHDEDENLHFPGTNPDPYLLHNKYNSFTVLLILRVSKGSLKLCFLEIRF